MGANTYLDSREREVLERARVGVAGAGGLGSNCAAHLVRSGVRRLVIADFDTVNESNLNRQFFFRRQMGEKKVYALAENLRLIEPDLELDVRDVRVTAENAAALFDDCDIVIEAFDAADQKSMLLAALLPSGRPVISASGIAGWGLSNSIRLRHVGRNLYLVGDGESSVGEGRAPASPRVGIAAAMQANAAVAVLLGQEP